MNCSGEVDRPTHLAGLKTCECKLIRQAECSFCGYTLFYAGGALDGWRVFGLRRRQHPVMFPIDYRDLRDEVVEWLCCPSCLAESGGPERISAYLNEPRAMHPTPAYTRVIATDGSTVEERTS